MAIATLAAFASLCADSPAAGADESCAGESEPPESAITCTVSGVQFEDGNGNHLRDPGDPGLAGWIAYADLDGNAARDAGEPFALSSPDGSYQLTIPFEQATVPFALRQETQPGWQCFAPLPGCAYAEQPLIDDDPDQQPDLERVGRDFGAVGLVAVPQQPARATAKPGFARLSASSSCPGTYTRMSVRGRGVANVSYFLDGRKLMTVIKPDSRGRFAYRIRSSRMTPGAHRIRARATYTAASATASTTLKATVYRCRPAKPRFAG